MDLPEAPPLVDRQGRQVTYIRLSVTDRCDLRCQYCLPARPDFLPKGAILPLDALLTIATQFVALGVTKVRITGGEPLVRRDLPWLLERIAVLPGLRELTLTTNGTRLAGMAEQLRNAGVQRVNISLDTLNPEKFRTLTRNGDLTKVIAGIATASKAGFRRLRLNTVLLPSVNKGELADLVRFAQTYACDITFIEEMPLGGLGREGADHDLDAGGVLTLLGREFELTPNKHTTGGPARYWSLADTDTMVGIIAPHTRNFCSDCNRVRITCTGDLYPCLGHETHTALGATARTHPTELTALIHAALAGKPDGHEFSWQPAGQHILRYMATTGG